MKPIRCAVGVLVVASLTASPLLAQSGTEPAPPAATVTLCKICQLEIGAWIFGDYAYRVDSAGKDVNQFELGRAYLNFRGKVGDRVSFRVTPDVYQQTSTSGDAYYKGWAIRMKYAYVGWTWLHGKTANDWNAEARIGLAQTIEVDEEEKFWPRYLSSVGTERNGFFSSSDLGIVNVVRLPNQLGEIYSTVQNGPGYTSRETDRWKDWATRVSITPLAHHPGLLSSFEIAPWVYTGTVASKNDVGGGGFRTGGLKKDRWGIFMGLRDPRLTVGLDYAWRYDASDNAPTPENPAQVVTETSGRLWSGYVLAKPLALAHVSTVPVGVVFRIDEFEPDSHAAPKAEYLVGGVTYDLNSKAQVAVDYQENRPLDTLSGAAPATTTTKTWYLHFTLQI